MKQIVSFGLSLAFVFAMSVNSSAAVVGFAGTFLNQTLAGGGGAGSALGAVPPSVQFAMGITAADGPAAGAGTAITSGTIWNSFSNHVMTVTGGNVILTDSGVNDTIQFVVDVSGNGGATNGQMSFNFTGDFTTGTNLNQGVFDALTNASASTSIDYLDFGNSQVSRYSGLIQAVPEPSSLALMVGLVCGVAGLRRRRTSSLVWKKIYRKRWRRNLASAVFS